MFSINSSVCTSPNKATHLLTLLVTERDDAFLVPCFGCSSVGRHWQETSLLLPKPFLFFALFCIFAFNQNEKQFQ